ncbi:MAG: DNA double-strand break repair nuclease NurA [Desulfurococcales archaeon]|nr:DNA double-strand break repair nuclease NurA [Desulfurococcales archaeon]
MAGVVGVHPRNPLEAAAEVKADVTRLLSPGSSSCRFYWQDLPAGRRPEWVLAADGGNAQTDLEDGTAYVVKAWASRTGGPGFSDVRLAAAGVVMPPLNAEPRIALYRETLEAAAGLAVLGEGGGLVLMDGSITTAIKWWRPGFTRRLGEAWLSRALEKAEEALEEAYKRGVIGDLAPCGGDGCIEDLLSKAYRRPVSARLAMRLAAEGVYPRGDGRLHPLWWIVALEVSEKLLLYRMLLEEAWRRGATVAFVAKTSRSTSRCGGSTTDRHRIARAKPVEPGVAFWGEDSYVEGGYKILRLTGEGEGEEPGSLYPEVAGLNEFYERELATVEGYVRLSPGGPLLHLTVPVKAGNVERGLREFWRAVEMLASLPLTRGYPAPLAAAHMMARVRREELVAALPVMGLEGGREDRRVLREWG